MTEVSYLDILGRGYRCPECDAPPAMISVKDSRVTRKYGFIMKRRTRYCAQCKTKFSTYELYGKDFDKMIAGRAALVELKKALM